MGIEESEGKVEIQRINEYGDERFDPEVLRQHGAFLVDGHPCSFRILDGHSAKVFYHDYTDMEEILETFRFYTGHINRFYRADGGLLREYEEVEVFALPIGQIQPSQFYVDQEKLQAVGSFIQGPKDIVIPVLEYEGRYVSADGHTRLYLALQRGYDHVRAFLDKDVGNYLLEFVKEAQSRGVYHVEDMEKLPHEEYEVKWNQFCDDFFDRGSEETQVMIEYRIATNEDMELLMGSRMEMLRVVNQLPKAYEFDAALERESKNYFAAGDQTSVLAMEQGVVIGCATLCYIRMMPTFSHPTGKRAHLMNVYTREQYRRLGIASRMVEMLIQEARGRGVTEISLDATESGRPLYERLGFTASQECMVINLRT